MRILEIVKADHDNFRRTTARIEATTEKDIEQRKQLLPQFMRLLYVHHLAEEETLFQALKKKAELKEMALDLIEEHRAAMILLDDLMASGWSFDFWQQRFRPFRDLVGAHMIKEETTIIPHLPVYYSEAELDEMSESFRSVKKRELD
jgi:hemerythrin superfamily protein